ncbi:hypothetical protein ABTH71_19910, partial [Acinetobacter baumannii]
FNILAPILPQGLDDVIELVLPELRRRGLFRDDYTGVTLRDHLGLARPARRLPVEHLASAPQARIVPLQTTSG